MCVRPVLRDRKSGGQVYPGLDHSEASVRARGDRALVLQDAPSISTACPHTLPVPKLGLLSPLISQEEGPWLPQAWSGLAPLAEASSRWTLSGECPGRGPSGWAPLAGWGRCETRALVWGTRHGSALSGWNQRSGMKAMCSEPGHTLPHSRYGHCPPSCESPVTPHHPDSNPFPPTGSKVGIPDGPRGPAWDGPQD